MKIHINWKAVLLTIGIVIAMAIFIFGFVIGLLIAPMITIFIFSGVVALILGITIYYVLNN